MQGTASSLMQNLSFLQPDYQDFSQLPVDDVDDLSEEEQVRGSKCGLMAWSHKSLCNRQPKAAKCQALAFLGRLQSRG